MVSGTESTVTVRGVLVASCYLLLKHGILGGREASRSSAGQVERWMIGGTYRAICTLRQPFLLDRA